MHTPRFGAPRGHHSRRPTSDGPPYRPPTATPWPLLAAFAGWAEHYPYLATSPLCSAAYFATNLVTNVDDESNVGSV